MGLPKSDVVKSDVGATRDRILDAAEQVFCDDGYSGASMRRIAEAAEVAQALLHYHFDTKDGLFEAMFARRSGQINARRLAWLDELVAANELTLENLIECLFRPTIEAGYDPERGGSQYSKILAMVSTASDDRSKTLVGKYYDPLAHRFIEALQACLPDLAAPNAVWAYSYAIGTGVTMMARTGRIGRLSGGACKDDDVEEMMRHLVPFICAGIRALAGAGLEPPPRRNFGKAH